ncbi:group 1 glycosyl transferase [Tolypothrix tenuis PCC 7101]|uniref:Group 1 glycosyl transferase n=1 Tax=Tolypothrix tenuis PCC 7101 TaxID=231146 RepID=A0A1Z4MWX2_9CYAN|nr:glycosyltransferase family 4 protein [Aulosira sp. FACHB-113]BAY97939.1 group 1 glycosyl transferase [Tolypothrix tenuis PCC 7101]BAZ71554.1 group 1 glycosyl transferase [Aulosira laxa NIES-50]
MIKLYYDYQIFSWSKYGGISRYIYEIATRTAKINTFEVQIVAGFYVNKYLEKCSVDLVKGWQIPLIPKSSKIIGAINAELSKIWLNHSNPDIVHETFYSRSRIAPKQCKTVITVYDMIHEKFAHLMPEKDRKFSLIKAEAIRRADHIICISQNTKQDLIEILEIDPKIISTIYLGYSLQSHKNIEETPKISDPYILYVGERRLEYKNFKKLLQAYASRRVIFDNFKLVCCGVKSFSDDEIAMIKSFDLDDAHVIYVPGDDKILANLYTNASAFIYPSLYEGFGIPPLEAMSFSCPVVCSNTSSIPEIVADAGEYFNPYELESIADALERVLFSQVRTKELVMKGKERVNYFSWDTCAEQTQLVYNSLQ